MRTAVCENTSVNCYGFIGRHWKASVSFHVFLTNIVGMCLPARLKSVWGNTNEYKDRNKIKQPCLIKEK